MKNLFLSCFSIMFCLILISGCSRTDSPILPENSNRQVPSYASLDVGVTDTLPDGTPSGGMGVLGLFQLRIDPSTNEAELHSLRSSALTDVLETVDISNFLQMAPCSNCVKIKSVALDPDGNLIVSIGIKHPFPAGDPFKPITGRNRADLHVFNIEGIVVSSAPGTSFVGIGATTPGFQLLNADGYTGYLDPVLDDIFPTDATIHPYILHFDDYSQGNFDPGNVMGFASVTDPPPTGNMVMAMGCDYNVQDYIFKLDPSKPVDFIYAVGCTYAISSATKSQRFSPEYRIPQHNKKAASEITVTIVDNNLKSENTSSTSGIEIRVVDLNHGVAVGAGLGEMLSDSSVDSIKIDIPGVMIAPLTIPGSSPVSGTGHSPSDPLLYSGTITNTASALEGTYAGLVKVRDTYTPGQNGSPILNGMDGIKRVDPLQVPTSGLFVIDEFATYQAFNIDVGTGVALEVISIVPEKGVLDSGDLAVAITGTGFDPNAVPKLVKNDNPSLEIFGAGVMVNVGGTSIDCTFNMDTSNGAVEGFYDVVVTNPGPPAESAQLDDGFEIYEFTTCDKTFREEIYAGTMLNHVQQIHGCAFTHDGLLLSRVNVGGYHLYGFDITQNGDISGVPVVLNAKYMNNSIGDIDVCDITGNIVYAICGGGYTEGLLNTFVVYTPSGALIGEYLNQNTDHLQGIDTDDDGSIWTVGHTYIDGPGGNYGPSQYYLNHYLWDSVNVKYTYDPTTSINITSFQNYSSYVNIYDIAVSFNDDRVLVYSYGTSYRGRIDAYDFSSGTPFHAFFADNLLPAQVGSHAFYNWRTAGDIEIDHSSLNYEYCRVLISARNYWTVGQSFSKVSTSGVVLDQWLNPNADAEDRFFWTHAINPLKSDPDKNYMVATEDYSSFGGNPARFHVFKVPVGW